VRLGFSIRVLGATDLPAFDATGRGDLGGAMVRLRDILHYARGKRLRMYRLHSRVAPQPTGSQSVRDQLHAARHEIALCGELARSWDVRLSFHPYSAVVLSTPDEEAALRSQRLLEGQAGLLDAMGIGPEAVVVLHVGGVYDGVEASLERFCRRYEALPASVQERLVLENDDHRYSFAQVLRIQRRIGIPLVFDQLHHQVHNPEGIAALEAVAEALRSWPHGVAPKIHYATPRSELKALSDARVKLPTWTEHADFADPFAFARFAREMRPAGDFDVMLESKARDLAVLKLREDLARFAPDVAAWYL
jgi:UV DNA damage endonuclease